MTTIAARATLHTTFSLGIRLAIQAATLLTVARVLGPLSFGEFAGIASLALTLGTLSSFGTNVVLLSEVSKNSPLRDTVLRYALPVTCTLGLLLLAAYISVANTLLNVAELSFTALTAVGLSETIVQPLIAIISAEYQGRERTPDSQWLLNLPLFLRLLVALALWCTHPLHPLDLYAYGYVSASSLTLIFAIVTLKPRWPAPSLWRYPTSAQVRYASGFALLNVTAVSPAELDKTLALRFLSVATAGIYAAGTRVIGALILPVIAMMLTILPRMFREHHRGSQAINHLLKWTLTCAGVYSIVLAFVLWQVSPVVQSLFGERYVGLSDAIKWLCVVLPGMAIRIVAGSSLMSMHRPWARVGFEATGLLILGGSAAVLSARFGIHGMILALGCSEWSMAILGCAMIATFYVRRRPVNDLPAA
jgi:O-antigen/teichoic acid export membrane protein